MSKQFVQGYIKRYWEDIIRGSVVVVEMCKQVFKTQHTQTHCLRKIFHNLLEILAFERTNYFNLILLILTYFFCVLLPFLHIFMSNCFWLDIMPAQ